MYQIKIDIRIDIKFVLTGRIKKINEGNRMKVEIQIMICPYIAEKNNLIEISMWHIIN